MNVRKNVAYSLFVIALAEVFGFIANEPAYWFVIDLTVIAVCVANGIILLKKRDLK